MERRKAPDEPDLNHRPMPIAGMIRESLVVLEESSGRRYRFGMPGPEIQKKEWERFFDELTAIEPPPDYPVASGSPPPGVPADFYARVARIGKARGAKLFIEVSGEALGGKSHAITGPQDQDRLRHHVDIDMRLLVEAGMVEKDDRVILVVDESAGNLQEALSIKIMKA